MSSGKNRYEWIDATKGLTISLVVFHHVLMGLNNAISLPPQLIDIYLLTTPIRMPLFFLIAGLFAKKSLFTEKKIFFQSKVYHFLYFYVLWNTISVLLRASLSKYTNNDVAYVEALELVWNPSFTLWFLYSLLLSFILARSLRNLSFYPHLAIAIVLSVIFGFIFHEALPYFISNTFRFYVFFVVGIYQSSNFIKWVQSSKLYYALVFAILYIYLAYLVYEKGDWLKDYLFYPMAFISILSIASLIRHLSRTAFFSCLLYVGKYSLYIYLMHFLPAAGFRFILLRLGMEDVTLLLALSTVLSILTCIAAYKVLSRIPILDYLVRKPFLEKKIRVRLSPEALKERDDS